MSEQVMKIVFNVQDQDRVIRAVKAALETIDVSAVIKVMPKHQWNFELRGTLVEPGE